MHHEEHENSSERSGRTKRALLRLKVLVQRSLAFGVDASIITLLAVLALSGIRLLAPGYQYHSICQIRLPFIVDYALVMGFKLPLLEPMCLALLYVVLTVQALGGTVGMRVFDLRIVQFTSGSRPGAWRIALRHVLSYASILLFGLGYLWAAVDAYGRTWHDIASSTLVVDET